MALKRRIEKLEMQSGDYDRPWIICIEGQKTESEAIAEWEAENGPLGNRKPEIMCVKFVSVSPPSGKQSEPIHKEG